jgi:CO dehydrogenase/acetyl-CoA synthase gamma subunit (corrinoid Fe-S protein)
MKKKPTNNTAATKKGEMLAEYDFSKAKRVGSKYVKMLNEGSNIVVLDPALQKSFPTSESVNNALKLVLQIRRAAL